MYDLYPGVWARPEPIMLLELYIMFLSIIPKTNLLCLKLCSGILSDNMKFIRLINIYMKKIHIGFFALIIIRYTLHYDSYNVFC